MSLIKTCETHHTVYYKQCSECLHEIVKAGKQMDREMAKRKKAIEKAKLKTSQARVKPKRQSEKMKTALAEYNEERLKWLPGKMCVVYTREPATTIHHAKGRIGYADKWARDNGVTLLMDKRYWIPASMDGHRYIEEHPQLSKDVGWSQSRLENLDQEKQTI